MQKIRNIKNGNYPTMAFSYNSNKINLMIIYMLV